MQPILKTSNAETSYQLYYEEVSSNILQIILKNTWKGIKKLILFSLQLADTDGAKKICLLIRGVAFWKVRQN